MIFSHTIWFFILFFIFRSAFGQINCDQLSPSIVKQFDTYSQKKFQKLFNKKSLMPQKAFDIATYFRLKADTTNRQWYKHYVALTMKKFTPRRKRIKDDRNYDPCIFVYLGNAYYYTDNFKLSYTFLQRATQANCANKCIEYYLS